MVYFLHSRCRIFQTSLSLPTNEQFDLLHLHPLDSEEACHLDYLVGVPEVALLGAELLKAGGKFDTAHTLGRLQTQTAFASLLVV